MERGPWVKSYRIRLKHVVGSGKSSACWYFFRPGHVLVPEAADTDGDGKVAAVKAPGVGGHR